MRTQLWLPGEEQKLSISGIGAQTLTSSGSTWKEMGTVHVGFLEALGLTTHDNAKTVHTSQRNANAKRNKEQDQHSSTSGLSKRALEDPDKILGYDDTTAVLRRLMAKHPRARVYVTGHSLGGSLAALNTALWAYNGETRIIDKLAAVYTFGQPRVGDERFAKYMKENVTGDRYFRPVYSNDMVPRIPFNNQTFEFKHPTPCYYYNSKYKAKYLDDAPQKNYFYIYLYLKQSL